MLNWNQGFPLDLGFCEFRGCKIVKVKRLIMITWPQPMNTCEEHGLLLIDFRHLTKAV
jgi:hypothetical protein